MNSRRPWVLWAALALIAGWHAATLFAPAPDYDEPAFADFARHGRLTLLQDLFPKNQAIFEDAYGFGLLPGHMAVLRLALWLFGVSAASLRAFNVIAGLLAVALLLIAARRLRLPWAASAGLLLFAVGNVFFRTTHNARPEAVILCLAAANAVWVWGTRPLIPGVVLGLLSTASLTIYPSGLYVCLFTPMLFVLDTGRSAWRSPALRVWALGSLAGALVTLFAIDFEQASRYFSFQAIVFRGYFVRHPRLMESILRVDRWAFHGFELLRNSAMRGSLFPYLATGAVASTLAILLRRWNELAANRRRLVFAAVFFWAVFCVLHLSDTPNYALYFFPWWFMAMSVCVLDLWKESMVLDGWDGLIITLAHLACAYHLVAPIPAIFFLSLAVRLTVSLAAKRISPRRWTAVLLVAFIAFGTIPGAPLLAAFCRHMIQQQPALLACLLAVPWLAFAVEKEGPLRWRFYKSGFSRSMAAYFAGACLLCVGSEQKAIQDQVRSTRVLYQGLASELPLLRQESRLVGPMVLTLFDPQMSMRSLDLLFMARRATGGWNLAVWIDDYRPSLLLWPSNEVPRLLANVESSGRTLKLVPGRTFTIPTPYGNVYQSFRLAPEKKPDGRQ